jgi:hypothetical protein
MLLDSECVDSEVRVKQTADVLSHGAVFYENSDV